MRAPTYLLERGFDAATIAELGWRVEPLGADWKRYGLPNATAARELVWRIPYRRNGRVEYERIRFVNADMAGGRYRGPKGSKLMPYDPWGTVVCGDDGVAALDVVLAVEGEANAVSVHLAGFDEMPVVGLPGQRMTKATAGELGGASIVYLWLDPGSGFESARLANARRLYAAGVDEVRVLEATDMDANAILVQRGPAALLDVVSERIDGAGLVDAKKAEAAVRTARSGHRLERVVAADLRLCDVDWLWKPWLPLGAVSLLAGQPGQGKTTLALQLAAQVTRGTLPGALGGAPANVVIVSVEDARDAVLAPALTAAGADLRRVEFLSVRADEGGVLDLTRDVDELERNIRETSARLLVLDPLVAMLPSKQVDSFRDQDVRHALAHMAEQRAIVVLAIMHLAKAALTALLGVGGSVGFIGLARSVLIFGSERAVEEAGGDERVLAHAKTNYGRRQRSRACRLEQRAVVGLLEPRSVAIIGDEIDVHADELVGAKGDERSERDEAVEFLNEMLADGPERATVLVREAKANGISERTLRRAKGALRVESKRRVGLAGKGHWDWVPPDSKEPDDGDRVSASEAESDGGGSVAQSQESGVASRAHTRARPHTPGPLNAWKASQPPDDEPDDDDWRQR